MSIKNSKTEKNLKEAFNFVAKRRTQYDIYALIAEKQDNAELKKLLLMFSEMEKEHAKLWFKWLYDGNVPSLTECLEDALKQEQDEVKGVYKKFSKTAKEEGFEHIAGLFKNIEIIEINHLERLKKVISKLKDEVEPNEDGTYNWTCSVCGCKFRQKEAPNYCPICVKENVFFYKETND